MKVLFAIGNAQTSKSVADKYYQTYGEKLEYKDVFYFRALLEEVRRDSSYDRIVISEELEPIKAVTIEEVDKVIFSNMDVLTDEAQNASIAFIGSDRRTKSDSLMSRFYNLGVYSILLGNDRNITSLCDVIKEPRTKKQAREYLDMNPAASASANTRTLDDDEIDESQLANILKHYEKLGNDTSKYVSSFESIEEQYTRKQLVTIAAAISVYLPSIVSETIGNDPRYASMFEMVKAKQHGGKGATGAQQKGNQKKPGILKFLSNKKDKPETYSRKVVDESAKIQAQEEENARIAAQKAQEEAKRMREESERQAREQAERLQKEKEERVAKEIAELKRKQEEQKAQEEAQKQAAEQEVLRQRMILEQKKKEDEQRREQEALKQKAIEEQKEREEAQRKEAEQEALRQRAIAEQRAKENAQKQVIPEIEIDISDLQKPVAPKPQGVNTNNEIEIDISDLQKVPKPNNQTQPVENKVQNTAFEAEQEALRQKALEEQKAKEEAQRKAAEQEALRQKALAEQKAKEEAQRRAAEQEALRQKALAEQKAKEEAQRQAAEQEALRQKALAEQKAKEEAQRQANEQEVLRQKALEEQKLREEAERIVREQMQKEQAEVGVTNITPPSPNSALISTDYEDDPLQSNFDIKTYQLPSDYKKVIAIVGTSKVGSTFIVNAIANSASEKKIQTAVLDMTKSKGLYYLYNKSDTRKIQIASECIKNLNEGISTPISVDKNRFLNIYTSLPGLGENRKNYKHKTIIDTIKKTCNLLIIDCDFTTPIEYFEQASEIYIVQDMDLIKLQETTAFLREFKNRGIEWSKLNVIINKYVKSSFTPKKIVEVGLAYYNDPQMTYTEEFEVIKSYTTVPFTMEDYARYTEDVARDKIVYKNYSIQLRSAIDQICQKIYPSNGSGKRKGLFK